MKLFIIKVIGKTKNFETGFMKVAVFSYVTGCDWNAFSLSLNESIRPVNSFLLIDFRETSLAAVSLKYLLSLFV